MPVIGRAATAALSGKKEDHVKYREKRGFLQRRAERLDEDEAEFLGCCQSHRHNAIVYFFQDIRDSKLFQGSIIGFILLAAVLVGAQTYRLDPRVVPYTSFLDELVLWVFVAEIVLKLVAEGRYPLRYFLDSWNDFDFVIVALSFLPIGGNAVKVLRLIRLLRVLRLVRALPRLRILVIGLLKSMSSIAYIGLLLLLLFYLYAVLGVSIFGPNDPVNMGTLHIALITLFRAATLEDWTDLMYINLWGCDQYGYDGQEHRCTNPQGFGMLAVVYYVSFVVISSFMLLNLFIGVISSSMQDAKDDLSAELELMEASNDIEDDPEDTEMEKKLNELSEIMLQITDQVETFAQLEKERKASSVVRFATRGRKKLLAAAAQAASLLKMTRKKKAAAPGGGSMKDMASTVLAAVSGANKGAAPQQETKSASAAGHAAAANAASRALAGAHPANRHTSLAAAAAAALEDSSQGSNADVRVVDKRGRMPTINSQGALSWVQAEQTATARLDREVEARVSAEAAAARRRRGSQLARELGGHAALLAPELASQASPRRPEHSSQESSGSGRRRRRRRSSTFNKTRAQQQLDQEAAIAAAAAATRARGQRALSSLPSEISGSQVAGLLRERSTHDVEPPEDQDG